MAESYSHTTVNIKWIDSETVTSENAEELFADVSGILVPGGFGHRGIEGKIEAIRYARTHNIPFLGLCLGMQLSIVEFARDVSRLQRCPQYGTEPGYNPSGHPYHGGSDRNRRYRRNFKTWFLSLRAEGKTLSHTDYMAQKEIHERHRHRYEVNNDYREVLEANGMMLCADFLRTAGS